jgi:hypothetical protein
VTCNYEELASLFYWKPPSSIDEVESLLHVAQDDANIGNSETMSEFHQQKSV